jgi:hypothetical protein
MLQLGLLLLVGLAGSGNPACRVITEHIRNRGSLAEHVGGLAGGYFPGMVAADRRVGRSVHGFGGLMAVRMEAAVAVGATLISRAQSALASGMSPSGSREMNERRRLQLYERGWTF